ncbi:MAG: hypothetical protein H8E46_12725 [FCB group bacterium]|nr:hypothetical protein [FCB group bacterium]
MNLVVICRWSFVIWRVCKVWDAEGMASGVFLEQMKQHSAGTLLLNTQKVILLK